MRQYKQIAPQNTLALLSLSGFDDLQLVDDTFVSFRFDGTTYETTRLEGRACIGVVQDVYSYEEFLSGIRAGVDLMKANPDVQVYYEDPDEKLRIRLWLDCASALDYEKTVFRGIHELGQLFADFRTRLQHHLFKMVAPSFNPILNRK